MSTSPMISAASVTAAVAELALDVSRAARHMHPIAAHTVKVNATAAPAEEADLLLSPASPGTKRTSRDGSANYPRLGSSAQCLSSEERGSPESDVHPDGFVELLEKPLKVGRTEGRTTLGAVDEADVQDAPLFPARPVPGAAKAPATAVSPGSPVLRFPCVSAPPPTQRGALTVLHSIEQLATLVAGAQQPAVVPLLRRARYTPVSVCTGSKHSSGGDCPATDALTLHEGETVIILLHRGRGSLAELVSRHTELLSHIRIFALDLSALPPQDYEEDAEPALCHATSEPHTADSASGDGSDALEHDEVEEAEVEEDQTLFVAGPAAPGTQQKSRPRSSVGGHGRESLLLLPSPSGISSGCGGGGGGGGAGLTSATGELSDQLNHIAEVVLHKVTRLLRVETVLNPHFFMGAQDAGSGAAEAKGQSLSLPAMVLWRAPGGESEDYSPYLPCSYDDGSTRSLSQQQEQFSVFSQAFTAALSSQTQARLGQHQQPHQPPRQQQLMAASHSPVSSGAPSRTTATALLPVRRYSHFGDYLRANGGSLAAKEVKNTDHVHSISLYCPVYTVAHLFKHIVDTAKAALWEKLHGTEDLLYTSPFRTAAGGAASAANGKRAEAFYETLERQGASSRTLMYLGASWCPPCMRIVGEMPLLIKDHFVLPDDVMRGLLANAHTTTTTTTTTMSEAGAASGAAAAGPHPLLPRPSSSAFTNTTTANEKKALHVVVKADMDYAKPIFDLLQVVQIPTFIVLDNAKLFELERRILRDQQAALTRGGLVGFSLGDYEKEIGEAIVKAELGRLQNSNREIINVFIEKHCTSLSFDEDF